MWKYLTTRCDSDGDANSWRRSCRSGTRGRFRAGAAAVEFAVCLPVLITVVLGSIEASNLIHVQHALKTAAYEAARTAGKDSAATSSELTSLAQTILDVYHVKDGQVSITPDDLATVSTGGQVTVTVTAPMAVNRVVSGWAPKWLLGNSNLSAQCTVVRG